MKRSLCLLALALVGCKSEPACRDQASALVELLDKTPHAMSRFDAHGITLVPRADAVAAADDGAPVVKIIANGLVYRGKLLDASELDVELVAEQARIAEAGRAPADPRRIYFAIDAGAPWQQVVDGVRAAALAGFDAPGFVFAAGARPSPTFPRTAIDDRLDRLEADPAGAATRATALAQMLEDMTRSCPALVRLFGTIASTEGDKAEHLIRGLGPALVECECNIDVPALRAVLWRMFATTPTRVVVLERASYEVDPTRATIVLGPETPWSTAAKSIRPGATAVLAIDR